MVKSVAIYCGSRVGNDPEIQTLVDQITQAFVRHKVRMVYGGGSIGIMGALADSMTKENLEVIGVIPSFLNDLEVGHTGVSELLIVQTMHERKEKMEKLADAFLILPGGIGTMDEFFEILTWKQLKLHGKKIAVLNFKGYYEHMMGQLSYMVEKGFIDQSVIELFDVYDSIEDFENAILKG